MLRVQWALPGWGLGDGGGGRGLEGAGLLVRAPSPGAGLGPAAGDTRVCARVDLCPVSVPHAWRPCRLSSQPCHACARV